MPPCADVIELPVPRTPADAPATRDRPARPWFGYLLVFAGVALVPWLIVLATGLPATTTAPHWTVAWVGLDSMEAIGLIATGLLTLRRSVRRVPVAAATAMLLVCDAWFDTTTSSGSGFGTALFMAFTAELPLAAVCAVLALRGLPRGKGAAAQDAAIAAADRTSPAAAPVTRPRPVSVPAPAPATTARAQGPASGAAARKEQARKGQSTPHTAGGLTAGVIRLPSASGRADAGGPAPSPSGV